MAKSIIATSIIGTDSHPEGVRFEVAGVGVIELRLNELTPDIATRAMLHGLTQKVADAAAISCNPDTGRSATPADKFDAMREVANRLQAGQWNKIREANGGAGSLLYRALVIFFDGRKSPAEVRAWLETKSKDERTALSLNPKIAAIIATLRAPADVDTDAMLNDLA